MTNPYPMPEADPDPDVSVQEVMKYKSAEEFITEKLGLEIERPKGNKRKTSLAMARYRDGRITIQVPAHIDITSPETQKSLWHEVGHYLDDAKSRGGRGQMSSLYTYGIYSTPNREILRKHAEYIISNRKPVEIIFSLQVHGKKYTNLDELLIDESVSPEHKEHFKKIVTRSHEKHKKYVNQDIELFAEGFSHYATNKEIFKKEASELAKIYDDLFLTQEQLRDFYIPIAERESQNDKDFIKDGRIQVLRDIRKNEDRELGRREIE